MCGLEQFHSVKKERISTVGKDSGREYIYGIWIKACELVCREFKSETTFKIKIVRTGSARCGMVVAK